MNLSRITLSSLNIQPPYAYRGRETKQWGLLVSLLLMLVFLWCMTIEWDWHRLTSTILHWTHPQELTNLLSHSGGWGPAIYITIIMISVVVSQIPGAPLAIAAGAIWDPLWAGIYTIAGGFGGALIAYGLGKWIGPSLIKTLTGKTFSFSPGHGTAYLGGLIFVTRLLPIFSFDLVSYGAGIARLSFPVYASATFLGMIPSTLLLTYMGGSFQLSSGAIATLITLLLGLFIGLPILLQRLNWLHLNDLIKLTAD